MTAVRTSALGLKIADINACDPRAVLHLPERWARKHCVFPLRADARTITVAISDPTDFAAEQAIGFATARRVVMELAPRRAILDAINERYQPSRATSGSEATPVRAVTAQFDPTATEAVDIAHEILTDAVLNNASDIHMEPGPEGATVRLRVDGVLRPYRQLPMSVLTRVVSRIKVLARLDIADRTRPQDGRARFAADGRMFDLRVSTIPTRDSEKAVIRVLRPETAQSLEDTGMHHRERALLRQLLAFREGLVLVTGPTGSGKTTTLYAALREVAARAVNITTVEDPIEYEIAGITQVQVEPKRGITFASALRSILRQDPDVILVGEIRDLETAEIALQASLTGHLVLATLHTNDALSAVTRLCDLGLTRASIAAAVRGSLAQRLVRKLCAHCTGGCHSCGGTGYRGRLPVVEVALGTPELADLIARDASAAALQAAAVAAGMRTLRQSAMERVRAGETTMQEVDRVVGNAVDESHMNANVAVDAASRLFRDIGLTGSRLRAAFPVFRNTHAWF